jgi:hypothetical protein
MLAGNVVHCLFVTAYRICGHNVSKLCSNCIRNFQECQFNIFAQFLFLQHTKTWQNVYQNCPRWTRKSLIVDIPKNQTSGGKHWKIDIPHTFKSGRVMFPQNHSIVVLVKDQSILEKYANYRRTSKMPFGRMIFCFNLVGFFGTWQHFASIITPNDC